MFQKRFPKDWIFPYIHNECIYVYNSSCIFTQLLYLKKGKRSFTLIVYKNIYNDIIGQSIFINIYIYKEIDILIIKIFPFELTNRAVNCFTSCIIVMMILSHEDNYEC